MKQSTGRLFYYIGLVLVVCVTAGAALWIPNRFPDLWPWIQIINTTILGLYFALRILGPARVKALIGFVASATVGNYLGAFLPLTIPVLLSWIFGIATGILSARITLIKDWRERQIAWITFIPLAGALCGCMIQWQNREFITGAMVSTIVLQGYFWFLRGYIKSRGLLQDKTTG